MLGTPGQTKNITSEFHNDDQDLSSKESRSDIWIKKAVKTWNTENIYIHCTHTKINTCTKIYFVNYC